MLEVSQGRTQLIGCALAAAIVAAPFFALRFGLDTGLAVAAAALLATAGAAWDGARSAAGAAARRLVIAAWANVLLAAVMVALIVLRRFGS